MEILEWFQLLNDLELNQTSLSLKINNFLFVLYVLLALLTKRVAPLAAFFMCVLLVDNVILYVVSECSMYLLVCIIYSYVFITCDTVKSKACCVIILLTTMIFALDAFFYGVNGYYGSSNTIIYNNIEFIALFVNLLFICSFIHYERIWNGLQFLFDRALHISRNSACFFIC